MAMTVRSPTPVSDWKNGVERDCDHVCIERDVALGRCGVKHTVARQKVPAVSPSTGPVAASSCTSITRWAKVPPPWCSCAPRSVPYQAGAPVGGGAFGERHDAALAVVDDR